MLPNLLPPRVSETNNTLSCTQKDGSRRRHHHRPGQFLSVNMFAQLVIIHVGVHNNIAQSDVISSFNTTTNTHNQQVSRFEHAQHIFSYIARRYVSSIAASNHNDRMAFPVHLRG